MAFICALLSVQSLAQSSPALIPRTQEERDKQYQNQHRIVLDVQTSSSSTKNIDELKMSDFVLFEDHKPLKISSFSRTNANSEADTTVAMIVLDALNGSPGTVKHSRSEIEKYLRGGNDALAYPMSIAVFSEDGLRVGGTSRDRATLLKDLDQLSQGAHSPSCAEDLRTSQCVASGPNVNSRTCDPNPRLACLDHLFNLSITALTSMAQKETTPKGRTIVVWLGEGWPLLNESGYTPDTPEVKAELYRNLVTASQALTEARITLDEVASSDTFLVAKKHLHESPFYLGVSNQDQVSASSLSLQALATQSGGLILTNGKNVAEQIAQCVSDGASYYSLAFDYPPASEAGDYHSIEVKTTNPDIVVRTRTLFYAEQ